MKQKQERKSDCGSPRRNIAKKSNLLVSGLMLLTLAAPLAATGCQKAATSAAPTTASAAAIIPRRTIRNSSETEALQKLARSAAKVGIRPAASKLPYKYETEQLLRLFTDRPAAEKGIPLVKSESQTKLTANANQTKIKAVIEITNIESGSQVSMKGLPVHILYFDPAVGDYVPLKGAGKAKSGEWIDASMGPGIYRAVYAPSEGEGIVGSRAEFRIQ